MKKGKIALSVLALMFFASCKKELTSTNVLDQQVADRADFGNLTAQNAVNDNTVPNELLVRFKAGTLQTKKDIALAKISANVQEHIVTEVMKHLGDAEGLYLVHTPLAVADAIGKMKIDGEVEFAEPNFVYQAISAMPSDQYFANGSLWGMYGSSTSPSNQYGSNAAAAWAAGNTGSSSVYVGVIDEGIQYTHPDLSGQVWTNSYDPADGVDNDKNGYKDDINGWDFANNDNTIYDGGTNGRLDDHGTHVSGTIGGKNNGSGVVGVNWAVKLISAKFLGRNGGTTANAVKAVDYLTGLKKLHGLNIVASNNSWGGGGFSQALYDAISRANDAGILFVAAAGNGGGDGVGDNNDATANYPSNYTLPNVIAVAAITSSGAKASYSNYGATTVDLGAPGSGIISTTAYNTYSNYSGTSMATPHVTGSVALYAAAKALTPTTAADAAAIKSAILDAAVPTASLAGKCVTGGRLDVDAAIKGLINH